MMRAWRANRVGFTLIEALTVVVILGILVTISGASVSRQLTCDRVDRAAAAVEGMLVEATQLAVRRRVPIRIRRSGRVLEIVERGTGTVVRSRGFGAGSDLDATLTLSPSGGVTIFPTGRADTVLTVTVEGEGTRFVVGRSATGIVRRQ